MKTRIDDIAKKVLSLALGTALILPLHAQDQSNDPVEEITVTGTQIKGANISDALAVSVFSAEDIELLGVDSGDELLDLIPENGQNFVNEAENISGGVNSARGDVGAFNLRNMGTGNTLVLLNGRRMVNSPAYQTEEVGGSFVPVNSVNSNAIPVTGINRVEVLRDGASAIYGADAVAGVVNHVLKTDFEGLTLRGKYTDYEGLPRNDKQITAEYGKFFNDGRTNLGVFFNYYDRGRVNSQDDPKWADADFRRLIPPGSPWEGDTDFRNTSINSLFGLFDVVAGLGSSHSLRQNDITDSAGEFDIFPFGDERCNFPINAQVCGGEDGRLSADETIRYNLNENRDLNSDLERTSLFAYLNHELPNGIESFTELSYYNADTNLNRHPSAALSASELILAADNYYNPFGPIGSASRLPDSVIGTDVPAEGLAIRLDNYRFAEVPRIIDNNNQVFRVLQGFRGEFGNAWDWEGAILWSKAESEDITHNRISNNLMTAALNDTTEAAYNPFAGGVNSNIERTLIDVRRDNETELTSFDFKVSKNDVFTLPAGDVGLLAGVEVRNESFVDDRDPRLDGTIRYTDIDGDEFPFVSDVVNSSPSPDSSGDRDVSSLFAELQVPVLHNLDVQAAVRYEDFSDVGDTTVGKFAFGWRPLEEILIRGSASTAFRAPNLVTVNEGLVARANTRNDYACLFADPEQDVLDCRNSIQRTAQGSEFLVAEESTNTSIGFVVEPVENFLLTVDWWTIEKDDTIGLFGEENHTILDLIMRLDAGISNCAGATFNPAIIRDDPDPAEQAIYEAAGICNAGAIDRINDTYANLDTRTVKGHDIGVYYNWDTSFGNFDFKYNGAFINEYEQDAGGDALTLVQAQEDGVIPPNFPVDGFADLRKRDGNQTKRQTASLRWNKGNYGASLTGFHIGNFYQSSLTLGDGSLYVIPAMLTYNATIDYRRDLFNTPTRFRFGVRNLFDERAPLADRFFGYFADAHRDLGRSFYIDLRMKFDGF